MIGLKINMGDAEELLLTFYCCPVEDCTKQYKSRFNLRRHVEFNHLGRKPFKCSTCERSFVSKQNLIEHQFIHSGVKPYKCSTCGLNFRQMSLLTLHKRSHDEDYETTLSYANKMQENDDNLGV